MEKLIVTTTVPGRRRGGAVFTGANEFELDHFNAAQLSEILRDNVLTVSVGKIIKLADVDAFMAQVQAQKEIAEAARELAPAETGDIQSGAAAAVRADTGATSDPNPAARTGVHGTGKGAGRK